MNPPIIVNSPEKGKDSLTYSAVFFVRLFLTGFGFGATSSEEDFGVTGFIPAVFFGALFGCGSESLVFCFAFLVARKELLDILSLHY